VCAGVIAPSERSLCDRTEPSARADLLKQIGRGGGSKVAALARYHCERTRALTDQTADKFQIGSFMEPILRGSGIGSSVEPFGNAFTIVLPQNRRWPGAAANGSRICRIKPLNASRQVVLWSRRQEAN